MKHIGTTEDGKIEVTLVLEADEYEVLMGEALAEIDLGLVEEDEDNDIS